MKKRDNQSPKPPYLLLDYNYSLQRYLITNNLAEHDDKYVEMLIITDQELWVNTRRAEIKYDIRRLFPRASEEDLREVFYRLKLD